MRHSWIVVSAFFMATTIGCGGKSPGGNPAEKQSKKELEGKSNAKAGAAKNHSTEELRQMNLLELRDQVRKINSKWREFERQVPVFTNGVLPAPKYPFKDSGWVEQKKSISELEPLIVKAGSATINPSLPNGLTNNGGLNFQTAQLRDTFIGNLNQDLIAMKKYRDGLMEIEYEMEAAEKLYDQAEKAQKK